MSGSGACEMGMDRSIATCVVRGVKCRPRPRPAKARGLAMVLVLLSSSPVPLAEAWIGGGCNRAPVFAPARPAAASWPRLPVCGDGLRCPARRARKSSDVLLAMSLNSPFDDGRGGVAGGDGGGQRSGQIPTLAMVEEWAMKWSTAGDASRVVGGPAIGGEDAASAGGVGQSPPKQQQRGGGVHDEGFAAGKGGGGEAQRGGMQATNAGATMPSGGHRQKVFRFEMEGSVSLICDELTWESGFRKREFVIRTHDAYPQDVKIECTQDRTSLLDGVQVGDTVKVSFSIRGSTWNGRHFTNLQAVGLESGRGIVNSEHDSSAGSDVPGKRPWETQSLVTDRQLNLLVWYLDQPANKQTNKQANKQANRQTDRQTDKQTNKQTNKQTPI